MDIIRPVEVKLIVLIMGHFKVLAISAPHWPKKISTVKENHLKSKTPFSLQNAIRLAVFNSLAGIGAWRESNWSEKDNLDESIYMSDFLDESLLWIERNIIDVNIVFIGAMTISMPGANEIASYCKKKIKILL